MIIFIQTTTFLWTGVVLVYFIKDENSDTSKNLLNWKNKDSVNTSAFCLMTFVGISGYG